MKEFSEILIDITGGKDPIMSVKQVAFHMGVDPQTVYSYRSGNNDPRWKDVVRLSHHLIDKHNYYVLAAQTMLVNESGAADGRVNDQLLSIMEHGTDLHRAHQNRDYTGAVNAYNQMDEEMKILKAEVERI